MGGGEGPKKLSPDEQAYRTQIFGILVRQEFSACEESQEPGVTREPSGTLRGVVREQILADLKRKHPEVDDISNDRTIEAEFSTQYQREMSSFGEMCHRPASVYQASFILTPFQRRVFDEVTQKLEEDKQRAVVDTALRLIGDIKEQLCKHQVRLTAKLPETGAARLFMGTSCDDEGFRTLAVGINHHATDSQIFSLQDWLTNPKNVQPLPIK